MVMTNLLDDLGNTDVHTMACAGDLVVVIEAESRASLENKSSVARAKVTSAVCTSLQSHLLKQL